MQVSISRGLTEGIALSGYKLLLSDTILHLDDFLCKVFNMLLVIDYFLGALLRGTVKERRLLNVVSLGD